tara:strand:+ start:459 stop:674 length:216 start_codon:yes stop_codon:yes gene_type:complete
MPALYFFVLNLGSGGLEDCPHCRARISNDTEHCPECGKYRPFDALAENPLFLGIAAVGCVLAMMGWLCVQI